MVQRLLLTAVVAGLVGGAGTTLLQLRTVIPLILEAETYEHAIAVPADAVAKVGVSIAQAHEHDGHVHDADDTWQPEDGLQRTAYTAAANILTGIGFSLLLVGCFVLRDRAVGAYQGALWGIAGFGAFSVAPALGLPPELPGVTAAELADRQLWWIGTAVATAAGLALVAFLPLLTYRVAGLVLIVFPHVIGAPDRAAMTGSAPPELAAEFVIASLSSAAVLWLLLGGVSGWLYGRWGSQAEVP